MAWLKTPITLADGTKANAQAPVIISASRATDIPAFYGDWLMKRMEAGYVKWVNPFNGVPLYVSFKKARLMVFWSKNPAPFLKHLQTLDRTIKNYYFQFTLNDYDAENLEPNVPKLEKRIETFIELSERIGKEKVIWRFDPLILTDKIGLDELLRKTQNIGNQLKGHTQKLVFSFADIKSYKKVQNNLCKSGIHWKEFTQEDMNAYARGLQQLNQSWHLELGTCAEQIPLEQYGITHNKCIDDDLIARLFHHDKELMDFLGIRIAPPDMFNPTADIIKTRNNKDKGQRELCGCIVSKDIGAYDTCPHGCEYCYANASREVAWRNWERYAEESKNVVY